MKFKLEFGSKWFYIFGILVAALFWLLFYFTSIIISVVFAPLLIILGAYLAIAKSGIEKEKWYIIANSLNAYGIAAGIVNVLFFLILLGPFLWDNFFEINGYVAAIGGLFIFTLTLGAITVFICSLLGGFAAFIRLKHKVKT